MQQLSISVYFTISGNAMSCTSFVFIKECDVLDDNCIEELGANVAHQSLPHQSIQPAPQHGCDASHSEDDQQSQGIFVQNSSAGSRLAALCNYFAKVEWRGER